MFFIKAVKAMFDIIKITLTGIVSYIVTYTQPTDNPIEVLGYAFVLDTFFSLLVDIIGNNRSIQLKNVLVSLSCLAMYVIIILFVYLIGERLGDEDNSLFFIKMLTYSFSYFYLTNVIRNMRRLAPKNTALVFLDYFIGLQIAKRLPELGTFLTKSQKENEENEENEEKEIQ
ncbi:hypothetical protein Barb7_02081 [Bacteroidales bacterium Barb7]|nr:hypothetical protein Barb7_02081 [Bacteroidales bacterium Barb7]